MTIKQPIRIEFHRPSHVLVIISPTPPRPFTVHVAIARDRTQELMHQGRALSQLCHPCSPVSIETSSSRTCKGRVDFGNDVVGGVVELG